MMPQVLTDKFTINKPYLPHADFLDCNNDCALDYVYVERRVRHAIGDYDKIIKCIQ